MSEKLPTHKYVPIDACLGVLDVLTTDQREAIDRLVQKPTVIKLKLWLDGMMKGAVMFALVGNRSSDDTFLVGLIEPDGSTHT